MKIILAQPRGFCAGVDRAIDIVKEAQDEALLRDLNERKAHDARMDLVEELLKKFKKGS